MGQLGETLARHDIVAVDTSPFIYLWEQHPRYLPLAEELFHHLRQPQVQGITSVITLIEACIHPQRQGRLDPVQAYENPCCTPSRSGCYPSTPHSPAGLLF